MPAETDRIIIPSKYKCETHGYYSDERPCQECVKVNHIKISELHGKQNFVMGALVDENGVMQLVINTADEGRLWATFHRLEDGIRFVLQQEALKRQATAIQTAPASVLDKLRG